MTQETIEKIMSLLDDVDSYARSSREEYSNARGNDHACYIATAEIRKLLVADSANP